MATKLGKRSIVLVAPVDLAAVVDCINLGKSNWPRAGHMAIALCWPADGIGRPKVRYSECAYDPGTYSGKVLEELVAGGATMAEIQLAGAQALNLVCRAYPRPTEVEAAEFYETRRGKLVRAIFAMERRNNHEVGTFLEREAWLRPLLVADWNLFRRAQDKAAAEAAIAAKRQQAGKGTGGPRIRRPKPGKAGRRG